MIEVHHAATDALHEHPNGARWHIDDKGQLHILSAKDDGRGNGEAVASYARGEWSSVRFSQDGAVCQSCGCPDACDEASLDRLREENDGLRERFNEIRGRAPKVWIGGVRQEEPDGADWMCPNCVTPWKCNGPHIPEQEPDKSEPELHGMVAWRDAQLMAARRQRDEHRATISALLDILVRGGHITLEQRTSQD